MMEKRVLIAAVISAMFLAFYSQTLTKTARPTAQSPAPASQTASPTQPETAKAVFLQPLEIEDVKLISSPWMTLEIGRESGAIHRARLLLHNGGPQETISFSGQFPLFSVAAVNGPLTLQLMRESERSVEFDAKSHNGNSYHISYTLDDYKPLLYIEINSVYASGNIENSELVITNSWLKADELSNRYNQLEAFMLYKKQGSKNSYKHYTGPFRSRKNVPRGTSLLSLSERYFCSAMRPIDGDLRVELIPSPQDVIAVDSYLQLSGTKFSATLYLGPRDFFHLKKAGFEEAFPVGALGQFGLMMLVALNWIAKITRNYGVAIILFSALVTLVMAPFTMLSVKSMKKMQELKPKMDRIMAQHKDDSKRANQEIFALYKEHRVSPLSGCLPMLLQMPIFIALFQAISHFIELRGKSFLWINDLSLPDRIAHLPVSVPILGSDVNLLPIIMAIAMFVQTRMSQQGVPSGDSNPTAKMMSGPMMPIIFGVMFYQFPSGLVLYWLTNSLMSLLWYRLAK